MVKLALALIVKDSAEEAKMLDQCLKGIGKAVDGIFITSTYKDEPLGEVAKVAKKYKAHLSTFKWVFDFAKARNFNFSQVPKEYTHILWCDADDGIRGIKKLKGIIEEHPLVDVFTMNYMYFFNEYKQPVVVHTKTQIVKNDGCVEWIGALHEDFKENRELTRYLIKGVERIHLTTETRIEAAKERNIEVSQKAIETNPEDPRLYWNYGNSLHGAGKFAEAKEVFDKFLGMSSSDEEKYLVHLRLSAIHDAMGDKVKAVDHAQRALGLKPLYPDAYHQLGQLYYNYKRYQDAAEMITQGLTRKPPYYSIIVYNPREYDVVPLMLLAKTFFQLSRPDQSIACLEAILKIEPKNVTAKSMCKVLSKEKVKLDKVLTIIAKLKKINDKEELKKELEKIPAELKAHPGITSIKNTHFVKETSSGRDVVIYCGFTNFEWSPETEKTKGHGGSEEAVLNLARQWAKKGWNVTVYNNCGHKEQVWDGVTYKPFWEFNVRDKQDVVVLWRTPRPLDHNINCDKILIDLHDVVPPGEFTPERLKKIFKVMVKTKFHRSLFPNIPDDKIAVIPNGMDFELFDQDITKDQYLLVNTSSPDRSMDVLPKLFKEVKKRVPQARLKWAYGWDIFDIHFEGDAKMMKWKDDIIKDMADAGIENMGRLSQKDCAKLYLEGHILAYPTEFAEIDCITVKKAQACGCIPVTTDFGALDESVRFGVKVHSPKDNHTWSRPFQFSYGLDNDKIQSQWVDAVVSELQKPLGDTSEMKAWTEQFHWDTISNLWINIWDLTVQETK